MDDDDADDADEDGPRDDGRRATPDEIKVSWLEIQAAEDAA